MGHPPVAAGVTVVAASSPAEPPAAALPGAPGRGRPSIFDLERTAALLEDTAAEQSRDAASPRRTALKLRVAELEREKAEMQQQLELRMGWEVAAAMQQVALRARLPSAAQRSARSPTWRRAFDEWRGGWVGGGRCSKWQRGQHSCLCLVL